MDQTINQPPQGSKRPVLTLATCQCGKDFTYLRGLRHRKLCGTCADKRQAERSKASKNVQRDRAMLLPDAWRQDQRRAYVSAEAHLNKALVQFEDLDLPVKRELLMRFMVACSDEAPRRKMPERRPQSD